MFKFIVTFIKIFKHACNVSKRANTLSTFNAREFQKRVVDTEKVSRFNLGHTGFMLPCMFVLLVISAFLVSISAI